MSVVVQYRPTHSNRFPSSWHFVASTGRLTSAPFHDFVESLKIGTRFSVGKKLGHLQSEQFFRDGRRHKLIDARTVFFALLLDRLFQRARQPQRISAHFRHFPILSIARRGVVTWLSLPIRFLQRPPRRDSLGTASGELAIWRSLKAQRHASLKLRTSEALDQILTTTLPI